MNTYRLGKKLFLIAFFCVLLSVSAEGFSQPAHDSSYCGEQIRDTKRLDPQKIRLDIAMIRLLSRLLIKAEFAGCENFVHSASADRVDYHDALSLFGYILSKGNSASIPMATPTLPDPFPCDRSPCALIVQKKVVYLAVKVQKIAEKHIIWSARAYNIPGSKKSIASYRIELSSSNEFTRITFSYERGITPFRTSDIPYTEHTEIFPSGSLVVELIENNEPGALYLMAVVLMIDNPYSQTETLVKNETMTSDNMTVLGKPGSGNQRYPRTPDGCSGPVNQWVTVSEAEEACCIRHDLCYACGGNEAQRQVCDEALFQCLENEVGILDWVPMPSPVAFNYFWRMLARASIRKWGGVAFRYHDQLFTCCLTAEQATGVVDWSGLDRAYIPEGKDCPSDSSVYSDSVTCPSCTCTLVVPQGRGSDEYQHNISLPCQRLTPHTHKDLEAPVGNTTSEIGKRASLFLS